MRATLATALALALLTTTGPVAHAAGGGHLLDVHDSFLPPSIHDVSTSAHGTLYVSEHDQHVQLLTGSTPADLGYRAFGSARAAEPVIRGRRVVVPRTTRYASALTGVDHCDVAVCPVMTTFAIPADYRYAGATEDAAVLYRKADHVFALAPWTGEAFTPLAAPAGLGTVTWAVGDAAGLVLRDSAGNAAYRRADGTFTLTFQAAGVALTPGHLVWYLPEAPGDVTSVRVLARDADSADWSQLVALPRSPELDEFAANDTGVAWLLDQSIDEWPDTAYLYSVRMTGGTPVVYPRDVDSRALAAYGDTAFLVNDFRAGTPGLYAVSAGSTESTRLGALPPRPALTPAVSLSHGRAAFVSTMSWDNPILVKDLPGGVPDHASEQLAAYRSWFDVSLSGPYAAYALGGGTYSYGRVGRPQARVSVPIADDGVLSASGARFVVSGGANAWLVDMTTHVRTRLARSYAAVFGDHLVTLNYDTGAVVRRNLVNGETDVVAAPVPGCVTGCVRASDYSLAVWGDEVVYSYLDQHTRTRRGGRWQGASGTTSALPAAVGANTPGYARLRYWAGLLLVYTKTYTVELYDLDGADPTAPVVVDTDAFGPVDLDGLNVAWQRDYRSYVRAIADLVPGHVAPPRRLGGSVPLGFGPGAPAGSEWRPSFLLSQDAAWTVTITDQAGNVVRELTGTTEHGEARPVWDGRTAAGADAPAGHYAWTLTGPGLAGGAVKDTAGLRDVAGSVYLSRATPGAPVLTTPARSTDESAGGLVTIRWTRPANAPLGTTYTLQQSYNGRTYGTIATTGATSRLGDFGFPGTYYYRVRATDPAGRTGPWSNQSVTLHPYDDTSGGSTGTWTRVKHTSFYGGSQRRAATAGYRYWVSAVGSEIQLIGAKGPNYGRFYVRIDDGPWSGPIDSYRAATRYRSVLYTKTGLVRGLHKIEVRVAGTPGRPYVGIDAVAYRR